jgi:hypothetical protein
VYSLITLRTLLILINVLDILNNVETVSTLLKPATNQQRKNRFEGVVSLLRRKPNFGFVGGLLGDLFGGGQFTPPMTGFFERFFHSMAVPHCALSTGSRNPDLFP